MKIHIPDFDRARVLVVGDLILDRYWYGNTSRISPEAPVPVVHVGESEERPGGAGNVALNVTALGGHAEVLGLTGNDEAARILSQRLEAKGVRCHFQVAADQPTVTKLRVVSRHQQLIRLDFEDGFPVADSTGLASHFRELLPAADVVALSDYGKGTLAGVQPLIAAARAAGKPVLVDPKGRDYGIYRGATLITPNMAEFESVVGPCKNDEEVVSRGEALRAELQLDALLVTRSEKGMTLIRKGLPVVHIPTRAQEVFDVTGAGDTVIAALAAGLAAGLEVTEATALANLAASVVVGKLGTASVTIPELRRAIREHDEIEGGEVDEDQLAALVEDARAHGERVVMTNGCFDILHAGHVAYLEQARRLGDRLVVAVNDDASVKRLKGANRPVNALPQRMAVLAALESVDWVVPFGDDTPERLICRVKPDVLVKGGDYHADDIAGKDCVIAAGGEVVVLDYVEGCSTTDIIDMIRGT